MRRIGKNLDQGFRVCLISALAFSLIISKASGQNDNPVLQYSVSMPDPESHLFHVSLFCSGLKTDTVDFKMPLWMPGYYQIMDYPDKVKNILANGLNGNKIAIAITGKSTWRIIRGANTSFTIDYDVLSDTRFVANNFLDSTHGYIIPCATFMYINGCINFPVSLKVIMFHGWKDIVTGLEKVPGKVNEFTAPGFDVLYDCPLLIGNLETFKPFEIKGIKHNFIAYDPGTFNTDDLISGLRQAIKAATDLMGDIPYNEYTFIGIGPGYGGIEHLNSATISFTGDGLDKREGMVRMLKFITHEYFHNYNVKRIRPYELGPFDYSTENKTNLLWVSEGFTVYYEYLIVRRAGLIGNDELLRSIEDNINTIENDEGRNFQSLSQSSYETWDDGPFGNKPGSSDRSISYYEKGPLAGMILDFSIRNATKNKKSLDDVMRYLYEKYYKNINRGFTDAEFQNACEYVAGISLSKEFEYVSTTKEMDYSTYLSFAGLKLTEKKTGENGKKMFTITRLDNASPLQVSIFRSWSGD
jgi:predicted metalloprotease with PDZ domain